MKIFISADIEGVTTTTTWDEANPSNPAYRAHAKQMTDEVIVCIEGAKSAGAREIVVRDAHGYTATNIDPTQMPSGVKLLRNWSGHPYGMAEGIDNTFNAAFFVGYHSAASKPGNPLSHTMSTKVAYIKINDMITSEFILYSYACALEGVPTVFLSGDKMLCEDSSALHPNLITCPVKEGVGAMTINYSIKDTLTSIKELSEKALKQDLSNAVLKLPAEFNVEVCYNQHIRAENVSWFPGVVKKDSYTVTFNANDYFEVLRTLRWIV